jgi:hypothetical protein
MILTAPASRNTLSHPAQAPHAGPHPRASAPRAVVVAMAAAIARTTAARFTSLCACLILIACTIAIAPTTARAQFGGGMFGDPDMMSPLTTRSVNRYADLLKLDAQQREILRTLFDGYSSQNRDLGKRMQEEMTKLQKQMQETGDYSNIKEMQTIGRKFAEESKTNETTFFGDLKALLTPEQTERFPRIEAARRRDTNLRMGFIAGQAVDLYEVAERAKVTEVPAVADFLATYETDMDRRLQEFERFQREQEQASEKMDPMAPDMERIQKVMKEMFEHSAKIRDINRTFARQIEQALPEDAAARFKESFNARAYPRIYRESYTHKALGASAKFADLTEDQKSQVQALRDAYARDAAAANAKWAAAVDAREEKRGDNFMQDMMAMGMGGGAEKNPVTDAKSARKELDERTESRLLEILNDDQESRLPKRPEPRPAEMDMMGDMFYAPVMEEEMEAKIAEATRAAEEAATKAIDETKSPRR